MHRTIDACQVLLNIGLRLCKTLREIQSQNILISQSMHSITFISTMHEKNGKCNADELYNILQKERPEVVFLESLESSYSNYEKTIFSSFGVYHRKLEIEAIQKYSNDSPIEYVPVLDSGLSDLFKKKYERICEYSQFQEMLGEFNLLAETQGFQFLNSQLCITLHQEMRMLENRLLNHNELQEAVNADIDAYENSMIRNIYSYCRINQFEKAVFMCGSAHRQSIIEKIRSINSKEKMDINSRRIR